MSSINEAIFRGRMRRNDPPPTLDSLNRSPIPLTSQFLARKAVEAVLAGGYTKCETEEEEVPSPEPAAPERSRFVRDAVLWACILALAAVIGLTATCLLPSHAVKARAAERAQVLHAAAVAEATNQALSAPTPAATEEAVEAPAPPHLVATATIRLKPAEEPQPAETPMQRVRLSIPEAPAAAVTAGVTTAAPVTRSVVRPVSKPSGLIAAIPDDQPVRGASASGATTVRPPAGAPAHPAVEEVLYEGEPAAAAEKTVATATRQRGNEEDSDTSAREEKASESAGSGKPRVEGIFYDKVRPMAIINGKIVDVGKQVGDYKVAGIEPGLVVLTRGGERLELRP